MQTKGSKYNIALITLFCVAIYTPMLLGIFQERKDVSQTEKRVLAKFPDVPGTLREIKTYPRALDTFYSDHFGFRESLNAAYFRILSKFESSSSSSDVTFGEDGWMFLGSIKKGYTKYNDPLGDAMNVNLYSTKELELFAKNLSSYKRWLNARGIAYIFVIAPNKSTIYFDKLPKYIKKQNKESATDQAVRQLRQHTGIAVVDPRESLFNERKKHQIYFKTDSHWNYYAANVAQFQIMNEVGKIFPGKASPRLLEAKEFEIGTKDAGDLSVIAMTGSVKEEEARPIFRNACIPAKDPANADDRKDYSMVCKGQKLKALIFRDSFFDVLIPYISRQFKRSTYTWHKLDGPTLMKYVELEKPDLVIHEIVERSFPYMPDEFKE